MRPLARAAMLGTLMMLAACASAPKRAGAPTADRGSESVPARPGGYYKDDGPGEHPPSDLDGIPDATPQLEPLHRFANRPYSVFGHDYVPATALRTYKERGLASWYGRRFHNQKTSTGETYDILIAPPEAIDKAASDAAVAFLCTRYEYVER